MVENMRPQYSKPGKENVKFKINKKKNRIKSILHIRQSKIGVENLENINESIRIHKFVRDYGKTTWKLVPKDSCEVYKQRRRRQMIKNRKYDSAEESLSQRSSNCCSESDKSQKKAGKKQRRSINNGQTAGKAGRRPRRKASAPTYTQYSSSASTSLASITDMDE